MSLGRLGVVGLRAEAQEAQGGVEAWQSSSREGSFGASMEPCLEILLQDTVCRVFAVF